MGREAPSVQPLQSPFALWHEGRGKGQVARGHSREEEDKYKSKQLRLPASTVNFEVRTLTFAAPLAVILLGSAKPQFTSKQALGSLEGWSPLSPSLCSQNYYTAG